MARPLQSRPLHRLIMAGAIGAAFSAAWIGLGGAGAQVIAPPKPIQAPPVPAPPRLGPPPHVNLGAVTSPGPPDLQIPAPANLSPVSIPSVAAITPADASDPTRPPAYVMPSGPTRMISPGANDSQIEKIALIVDPGDATLSPSSSAKLNRVAASLKQNPAARLEVRVFSPSTESDSQSNARRLSLARFMAIRDFLVHAGIASGRIDGRPLVSQSNELNPDRVELYIEH